MKASSKRSRQKTTELKGRKMQRLKMQQMLMADVERATEPETEYSNLHGKEISIGTKEEQPTGEKLSAKKRKLDVSIAKTIKKKKKPKNNELTPRGGNMDRLLYNNDASSVHNQNDSNPTPSQNRFVEIVLPNGHMKVKRMETSLTDTTFNSLNELGVSKQTLKRLTEMGFTHMTEVQHKSLPSLLEGRDLLTTAKPGCGKTLTFLIPVIEMISKLRFTPQNGIGAIIVSPTRETAMQIYGVLGDVMKNHQQTYGLVMGGSDRTYEAKKLENGVNILVATPGRLLYHLQNTDNIVLRNFQCFIMDDTDKIVDLGLEEEMKELVTILPKKRQTMLFSESVTEKIEDLAKLSLKRKPLYVGTEDIGRQVAVAGLKMGYAVCPSEKRFLMLFGFLKRNLDKKIAVFFSSCMSVKFHFELMNYMDLPCLAIHGLQKQAKSTATFFQFCNQDKGVLLCTGLSARGLDLPELDWIVQFDPPGDIGEYISVVGRAAASTSRTMNNLLVVLPSEIKKGGILQFFKNAKLTPNQLELSWAKIANVKARVNKLIENTYFLHKASQDAYKSYIQAYASHSMKDIYDVHDLDLVNVANSFGFDVPPYVDLDVHDKERPIAKQKVKGYANLGNISTSKVYKPVHRKDAKKPK